ncbi:MAG TPA: EamA family transporter [Ignavibacteria bacterium]|nr:EamA family transporter [Ignavibacteria bacterium]
MEWYWLAIASALLSAFSAIMQKKVLGKISALNFTVIVSVIIALLSTILVGKVDLSSAGSFTIPVLIGKSIINAAAFLCIMTALKNLEISRALPILAASPMTVALLAFIFLGESLSLTEVMGMLLIVSGTYILELKKSENISAPFRVFIDSKYHRIILIALGLMTLSAILDKLLLTSFRLPPLTFLVLQNYFFLIIFLLFRIFNGFRNKNEKLFSGVSKEILLIIIFIAIATIGYRWTQIEATRLGPVGLVIAIKRLSVLFAVVIGAKLFNEENYLKKVIATITIVAGALLIYD